MCVCVNEVYVCVCVFVCMFECVNEVYVRVFK